MVWPEGTAFLSTPQQSADSAEGSGTHPQVLAALVALASRPRKAVRAALAGQPQLILAVEVALEGTVETAALVEGLLLLGVPALVALAVAEAAQTSQTAVAVAEAA